MRSLAGDPEELAGADPNPCSHTLSHFTSQQLMALLQPDRPFPVISCFLWPCGHQREASRERPTLPSCRWSCVPCAGGPCTRGSRGTVWRCPGRAGGAPRWEVEVSAVSCLGHWAQLPVLASARSWRRVPQGGCALHSAELPLGVIRGYVGHHI